MGFLISETEQELTVIGLRTLRFGALTIAAATALLSSALSKEVGREPASVSDPADHPAKVGYELRLAA